MKTCFIITLGALIYLCASASAKRLELRGESQINCNGSAFCDMYSSGDEINQMNGLKMSVDPNRHFSDGENIMCIQARDDHDRKMGMGICAFPERGGIMGYDVGHLFDRVIEHDCHICARIALGYYQGGSTADGMLKIDYKGGTSGCDGVC